MDPLKILTDALDYQHNYEKKVEDAAEFLRGKLGDLNPTFAITLGSGLGGLAQKIVNPQVIPYSQIPNFPTPTIKGHAGNLYLGQLEGVPVVGLQGRTHYYEVSDKPFNQGILEVVFAVNVMANLGVKNYFVTNAAGGLDTSYKVGDLMALTSHMPLGIPSPLPGRTMSFKKVDGFEIEDRFLPMHDVYDEHLTKLLLQAGGESMHSGSYGAVVGPNYETKAQVLAFRKSGLQTIGMSTIPEVEAARNRGMRCVGFSLNTNSTKEDGTNATSHPEVIRVLNLPEVKDRIERTVLGFFQLFNQQR